MNLIGEASYRMEEIDTRRNDDRGFERLFERYARPVQRFFARRGFSGEECRDLTQETFLGVHRGMDRFRRESSVETWLFTIAANVWRNEVRNRSAGKREGTELPFDAPAVVSEAAETERRDDALDALVERERLDLLRRSVEDLPAQMRRCLLLRVDQELKYREIAVVMQVSIETVKSQLFQAKEKLKEALAEHFTELEV